MSDSTCENCRFAAPMSPISSGVSSGLCRRRAPVPRTHEQVTMNVQQWPLVRSFDWCGEFEPRTADASASPRPSIEDGVKAAAIKHGLRSY